MSSDCMNDSRVTILVEVFLAFDSAIDMSRRAVRRWSANFYVHGFYQK
jgi:hypothetical protein